MGTNNCLYNRRRLYSKQASLGGSQRLVLCFWGSAEYQPHKGGVSVAPTAPGRHRICHGAERKLHRPRHSVQVRRRQLNGIATATALACAIGLTIVGLTTADASANSAIVASDSMDRTVSAGFGPADEGGTYTVSSQKQTHVNGSAGVFGPVAAGRAVSAVLSDTSLTNVDVQATVHLAADPNFGSGVYFSILLRLLPNNSAYYATLRAMPDGRYALGLSEHRSGATALTLGKQVLVPGLTASTETIGFAAQITGTTKVTVQLSAWAKRSKPASNWQFTYTDASAFRLSNAGRVGFMTYLSSAATVDATAELRDFTAWVPTALGSPSASPTQPPSTSTAPPATAPTSSASSTASTSTTPAPSPTKLAPTTAAPSPTTSSTSPPPSSPTPTSSSPTSTSPGAPPSPPGSTETVGATLGSANYSVPASALFVSPSGNDDAAGSKQAPWRTAAHAIAAAPNNATIVLRGGTYHESVTVPGNKTLTIEAFPGEIVWFDGSTSVTSWIQSGGHWVASDWTSEFDSTPSYTGKVPPGGYWTFVNPAHPMASHPDQVWLGDAQLSQVGSADQVTAGTFYVDYKADQIVIAQNPVGLAPRASDLAIAITVNSPNSVLRGFGVRRYATAIANMGSVRLGGTGDSADNLVVSDSSSTGLSTSKANVHVSNLTLSDNGMLGMNAVYADGLVINSVLSENNNAESFNFAPVSGGIKIGRSRGVVVSDSTFQSNNGPGLWFDESCYNVAAVGNSFLDNAGNGMSFEISSTGIFANNVVSGNGAIGFKINNSNDARIWNNSFAGNGNNINIAEDARRASNTSTAGHDPRQPNPDPAVPWIIYDDDVMNNIFQPTVSGAASVIAIDYTGQHTAAGLGTDIDGNMFVRPDSGHAILSWDATNKQQQLFATAAAFTAAAGIGQSNVDASAAQWSTGGQSLGRPLPLPADVASATGMPLSMRHLGTFG